MWVKETKLQVMVKPELQRPCKKFGKRLEPNMSFKGGPIKKAFNFNFNLQKYDNLQNDLILWRVSVRSTLTFLHFP